MQYIKCDVSTICIGLAASFGAFLLAGGTKGKRIALPNAEIMIPTGNSRKWHSGTSDRHKNNIRPYTKKQRTPKLYFSREYGKKH